MKFGAKVYVKFKDIVLWVVGAASHIPAVVEIKRERLFGDTHDDLASQISTDEDGRPSRSERCDKCDKETI